ncbi:TonB-dependent receptor [Methylosinus sp. R-45379]|uniref:TonB-dependent siderophore receptor n=1 Tax=Methylosinus sp. R-45379 TaxID=980563 RepID=UPI0007C9944A|nr:TonB-dependent receptor [Methylosinus sp. R-45379]OAI27634.1 TonB-dependent receptor [Methylosinus sp. R-45379]
MNRRFSLRSVSALALVVAGLPGAAAQEALPPISIAADERRAAAAKTATDVEQTTAGPVRGYQALTARIARMATPLKELPLSVVVVPRKLIDDQNAISQSELFQNISGLTPLDPRFPGGLGVKLRGMDAERYIDGLPNYGSLGERDLLVNVERVEVLKGPANILFQGGSSPIGGVVNIVSKLPTPDRFAEVGVRAGGYRFGSPYLDINQPLNESKTLLFRFAGQFETSQSIVDRIRRQSYTLDPTLTITNNAGTSLTLQGHIARREQQDYPGLPAVGSVDRSFYSIRRTAFLANAGLPVTSTESQSVTARFDHAFDDTFSTFTTARYSVTKIHEPSQLLFGNEPTTYDFGPYGVYGGPSQFYVANDILDQKLTEFSISSNFVAKFDYGPTRNRLLVGGDFNRVVDHGVMAGNNATDADPFFGFPQLIDFRAPYFPAFRLPVEGAADTVVFTKIANSYQNAGASVQLQSTIFDRLHFLGALRVATVDIHFTENAVTPPTHYDASATRVLPRVGATYDVTDWLSVYGSYSEGLRGVSYFSGANNAPPKPEGSRQLEGGVKLDGPFGLSGTLAYFDLTRTNVPTAVSGSLTQRQTGEQNSHGFEADLVWQPTPNLSFLGSYAHIDAKVTSDENTQYMNARLVGTPSDSGRFWGHYAFDGALQGWSFGAGFYAASSSRVELGRTWTTPGYITFDADVAYKHENFTFSIAAKNLGDRRYYVQYPYLSGRVAPGEGRTFFATVSVKM